MEGLLPFLATIECAAFAAATLVIALLSLFRRARPTTQSRVYDIGLSAILFVFLGVRGLTLGAFAIVQPAIVLPGATMNTQTFFAALFVFTGLFGLITHRARVGWRVAGIVVMGLVAVCEVVANATLLDTPLLGTIDTFLALGMTALGAVFAAFFWNYRTAIPKPLGTDNTPFDY